MAAPVAPPMPPPMAASMVELPAFAAALKRAAHKKVYRIMVINVESSE
jgi:hypothetical protein